MNPNTVSMEELPSSLHEIALVVGLPSALKLAASFGGTEIHLPKNIGRIREEHCFCQEIGLENTRRLAAHMGGGAKFYIPNLNRIKRKMKRAEIVARYDRGESVRDIALAFGFTERWVRAILNNPA